MVKRGVKDSCERNSRCFDLRDIISRKEGYLKSDLPVGIFKSEMKKWKQKVQIKQLSQIFVEEIEVKR